MSGNATHRKSCQQTTWTARQRVPWQIEWWFLWKWRWSRPTCVDLECFHWTDSAFRHSVNAESRIGMLCGPLLGLVPRSMISNFLMSKWKYERFSAGTIWGLHHFVEALERCTSCTHGLANQDANYGDSSTSFVHAPIKRRGYSALVGPAASTVV
jgi:hypothetical protein